MKSLNQGQLEMIMELTDKDLTFQEILAGISILAEDWKHDILYSDAQKNSADKAIKCLAEAIGFINEAEGFLKDEI